MVFRLLAPSDAEALERMMLIAGFSPDRELPADAPEMSHIRRFLDGWGQHDGDVGVIALDDSQAPLGAAWARVLDEPLLREEKEPIAEPALAVEAAARGRSVGGAPLEALADAASEAGHRALSLTVSPRNPARRFSVMASTW